ncbi:MAG TPA: DUF748 domain-containing protein [Chryseolinea sp.]|jgi:hypothetical protein|nr:DUF748 domain-containing protein [Chryseolinea sp.]
MKKPLKITLIVVVLLICIRLVLPYVLLHFANKNLASIPGYYGHIEDIDLALIRGAYRIDSIYLNKQDSISKKQTRFFSASAIDLSLEWRALFSGAIVGELIFERPNLRFTREKVEPQDVEKDSSDLKELKDDFMPLQVNRFEILEGNVRYLDSTSNPKVDILMTNIHVVATNLRNSYDSSKLLPAKVIARANVYEGEFTFSMNINPLAKQPTFDMNAEMKNTNLVLLNDFFKAYAKIDVNKGKFGMYTEVAAKEGSFKGYVKPIIKDLDVLGHEDRNDNVFRKMWEGLVGFVGQVFKNQSKDQVATKIPFEGRLDNPETNIWTTIINVLQNAFIQAIQPSIDSEINIASVETPKPEKKTFLEKIFGSKDDDEKKEEKKDKKEENSEKRNN